MDIRSGTLVAKKYTMEQLKAAWATYKTDTAWRVVRAGGQKSIMYSLPEFADDPVVRCEMVKVRDVIEFPAYLERMNG